MAILPPDTFPLIYYRGNPADIELTIDDALKAPIADARVLLVSGTGLSQEPSRSATIFAAEQAQASGTKVLLDFDLRTDQWYDLRASRDEDTFTRLWAKGTATALNEALDEAQSKLSYSSI